GRQARPRVSLTPRQIGNSWTRVVTLSGRIVPASVMQRAYRGPDELDVADRRRRVRDDDRDDLDGAGEEHPRAAPEIPRPDPLRWNGGGASDRGAVGEPHRARPRVHERLTCSFSQKT